MPALKSDITITIKAGEKSFSIGGVLLPDGRYAIKRGRSWAKKIKTATALKSNANINVIRWSLHTKKTAGLGGT